MTNAAPGWALTVMAPTEFCTDDRSYAQSNFLLAIVHPEGEEPSRDQYGYLIEGDWQDRTNNVPDRLVADLARSHSSQLTVELGSDAAEFFPLFPYLFESASTSDERIKRFLAVEPGPCDVRFIGEHLGIAAYLARWKPLRKLEQDLRK